MSDILGMQDSVLVSSWLPKPSVITMGNEGRRRCKGRDADDALHQEGAPNLGHRPLNKSENSQESYTRQRLSAKGTPKPRGPGF